MKKIREYLEKYTIFKEGKTERIKEVISLQIDIQFQHNSYKNPSKVFVNVDKII